ncbi:acyltransferase [Sphingomonas sp. AP4-R1]|uniref:acyltransferase family protein n=1 Tax=Sphingomonas sp. AP4-R1 TaxID=2735134 RepID=UPI001493BD41|nr:acyltransferase [Sphingomonas sp. AP4-R1]QJU56733.1 acyltransferase [Sphingomonas sp. AP4-R1]
MHKGQERIGYLDGLRGVAILLTAAWHFLGPIYQMHLPYGRAFEWWPGVRYGWAGVNLFFLISGYVIFITLERCTGFVDFILRRWLRLFPAMLVASLILYAARIPMGDAMPGGYAQPGDLLPGLMLINPVYIRTMGVMAHSLDGAFWSLYVEAAFYIVIGLAFFRIGWARSVALLLVLYALSLIVPVLVHRYHLHWALRPTFFLYHAGFQNFGWFASGALFLKARQNSDRGLFWMALAIGLCSATTTVLPGGMERSSRAALFAGILFFAAVQQWRWLQDLLAAKGLLWLGFVSYPFYLLHSAIGVGLIAEIAPLMSGVPVILVPLLVLGLMIGLAWIIAARIEPPLVRLLRPVTDAIRRLLGVGASSQTARVSGEPA